MVKRNAGQRLRRGALDRASRGLDRAKLESFLRKDAKPDEAEGRLPSSEVLSGTTDNIVWVGTIQTHSLSGDNLEAVAGRRGVWGGSRRPGYPGCPPA